MAKRATVKREPRSKQQYLPDMEPPRIPAIDAAAETYYEAMMERCRLSKEEDEAKQNLLFKMAEHGLERYETPDGLVVTVTSKQNCKAKRKLVQESESGEAE